MIKIVRLQLRREGPVFLLAALMPLLLLSTTAAFAGSATWELNPSSGDWNTDANWTPATGYPNGTSDTATFDVSNTTALLLSNYVEVDGTVFNPGASAYTIMVGPLLTLTLSGTGITNNSGITQNFVADVVQSGSSGGIIAFTSSATAGSQTIFTANGAFGSDSSNPGIFGGTIQFFNAASATSGNFTANGSGAYGYYGGFIEFRDTATAANGTFTFNGAVSTGGYGGIITFTESSTAGDGNFTANGSDGGNYGGFIEFYGSSSAGNGTFTGDGSLALIDFYTSSTADNATLTAKSGSYISCYETSTAGNATLIADTGGRIGFYQTSTGGTARLEVTGLLDISGHDAPGVTIGSLEGPGSVLLGFNNLTVGSNSLSTTFSGTMYEDGSVTKIGTGTLTLSGANSYTGTTTIEEGTLLAQHNAAPTGTGPVQVNAGTLGGRGKISGSVTVGSGSGPGAFLAPGVTGPGRLIIRSALTFNADGIYNYELNTRNAKADTVVADGVTINSGAIFSFLGLRNRPMTTGTTFTVIDNRSAQPIAGTFFNLADGSTFTANGNTFQANYEGGNGNDLTLTVVP